MSISIMLADDQTLVREGIRSLLQLNANLNVIGEAADGKALISLLEQQLPDVLLLDIRMPVMSGVDVLEYLTKHQIELPVLVLTTFDDHDLVLNCIKLGARGYLRKDVNFDDLTCAIEKLAQGETWLQPAMSERVSKLSKDLSSELVNDTWQHDYLPSLTKIEVQVLKLVAAGYSNHEIADALYKSVGTVRNQVSSILTKLDARDRTRAVLKALDLGLI
ncbi:response regulator transcription factor [Thalassotalea marina]|uniref:DNA-binding response regulator n=1 Tax=Thalassotalea marina TaxID=1673741 RepID=A0A919BQG3_9GAMM|nr:response regulator transcription factor [Thalassotalea marina]GHG06440.1 DNA-binding response regulator [Thalassotalea marina]